MEQQSERRCADQGRAVSSASVISVRDAVSGFEAKAHVLSLSPCEKEDTHVVPTPSMFCESSEPSFVAECVRKSVQEREKHFTPSRTHPREHR